MDNYVLRMSYIVFFLCLFPGILPVRFDKEQPYEETSAEKELPVLFLFNAKGTIYPHTFSLIEHHVLAFFLSEIDMIEDGALCVPPVYHLHITFTYIRNLTRNSIGYCPSLYYLTIKGSTVGLETNSLTGLVNLKVLDLTGLKTKHVTKEMFRNLNSLRTLSFIESDIQTIDAEAFDDLINLKTLDLKMNELSEIGDCLLNLRQLFSLDLSHNRLTNFSWKNLRNLENLKILSVPDKQIRFELVDLLPKYCPKLVIFNVYTKYCINLREFYEKITNETNVSMVCRQPLD